MFTHRTATPGRVGSNDGFGLDASMSFHQNKPGSGLFVVYADDYDSNPRPNVVSLRNRAFVVKFNRLFRL